MFDKTSIETYFLAEKAESKIFVLIGIAGILAAIIFLIFMKGPFYKGLSIPLIGLGLLLCAAGYTVYNRSSEDIKRNVYNYDMNPGELTQSELPRMKIVMKNFVIYRWIEIAVIIAGAGLFVYFKENSFLRGWGAGLAIMGVLAVTADFFAEKRGAIYVKGLEQFSTKHRP
jgi:hypothetical protein